MDPAQAPASRIEFANALRGLASLAVVVSHYLGVFWLRRDVAAQLMNAPPLPVGGHPTPGYVDAVQGIAPFDWGAFGVALFFLISGFVIPLSLRRYDWKGFAVGRLLRLYPTYLAGLTVTLAAVYICGRYFDRPFPYDVGTVSVSYAIGLFDLLRFNNIDGIVWSLQIEVRFYILCALLWFWFRRNSPLVLAAPVALAILCLAIDPFIGVWEAEHRPLYHEAYNFMLAGQIIVFMFIGVAFSLHRQKAIGGKALLLAVCGLFGLFALVWHANPQRDFIDQLWSYGLALGVFAAAMQGAGRWSRNRILGFFADISYPLYVVHGVAGYVLLRLMLDRGMPDWLAIPLVTAAAIGVAWLLHRWIEVPSHRLGQALARRITARATPGAGRPLAEA